ncbi:MAG: hypothetical protein FJ146_11495 [Deltaproteobacteria bacterium]|nr:hypothetical protein [Deltaproteobacteria bacterium]
MLTSGLGRLLLEDGLLTDLDFRTIKRTCGNEGPAFARSVLAIGLLAEDELAAFLAEKTKWQVAPVDLLAVAAKDALLALDKFAMQRLEAVPVKLEDGVLHVAVVDPLDQETLSQLRFFSGLTVRPMIATLSSIRAALKGLDPNYQPARGQLESFMTNHAMAASRKLRIGEGRIMRAERRAPVAPVVRHVMVSQMARSPRPLAPAAVHQESFAKADPPIGIETARPAIANNEDLLDDGMHTMPAGDAPGAGAMEADVPLDNTDLLMETSPDAATAEVTEAALAMGETPADPQTASQADPLAALSEPGDDDFLDEPEPTLEVAAPVAELSTEPSDPPLDDVTGDVNGDDLIDEPVPDEQSPANAPSHDSHPSDEEVEALFADTPLEDLAGAPPVEVPQALVEEAEPVEAAVTEVEEVTEVDEVASPTEPGVADDLTLDDDSRDLTLAAGLNRAVLSLTMAQSLEKAVERVAVPMAAAGITAGTIGSIEGGIIQGLLAWDGSTEDLQLVREGFLEGITVGLTEALVATGDTWQQLDLDLMGDAPVFVRPPREHEEIYAMAINVGDQKQIFVLLLSTMRLTDDSVIGSAALDLSRRLAKKS